MSPKILIFVQIPLTVSLAHAIPVSVQVNDPAGQPLTDVTVEAQVVGETDSLFQTKTTDDKGLVQFEATPSKLWPDYLGRFNAWKVGRGLTGGNLTPGGVKITLLPGATLGGTVLDKEQKPLAGVAVRFSFARSADGRSIILNGKETGAVRAHFAARSDAQGRFRLTDLPPDSEITLAVEDPRFVTAAASGRAGNDALTFSLRPGATLRGTLLDAAGAPLSDIRVYANGEDRFATGARADATTDAQGHYVLSGLSSGNYKVEFSLADELKFIVAPLQVRAVESQVTEIPPTRAQAGVLVRGTVRDTISKQAVAGASIRVQGLQPALTETYVESDERGHWEARVLAGMLRLSLNQTPPQFLMPNDQGSRSVEVPGAGLGNVDFELRAATKITGRIVDEQGKGVKTQLMMAQSPHEWPLQSDENGDFTAFGPASGEVLLERSRWNEVEEGTPTWEILQGAKIQLPARAPLSVVVRQMVFGAIEGTIVDENGAPLANAEVTLQISTRREDGSGTRREVKVSSDEKGRFRREKLHSNESVQVSASKANYDFASGGKATKTADKWTVTPLVLRARTARLAGRVVDSQGQGVAGASVFAAGVETRSAPNGAFALENLPTAEIEVMAYQGQGFALVKTDGKGPVELALALAPVTLQGQDIELARAIIEEARAAAQNTKYYAKDWLKLSANGDFAAQLQAAQALDGSARDGALTRWIASFALRTDAPTATLLEAVRLIGNQPQRLYSAGTLWSKRSDWPDDAATRELVVSLNQSAGEQTKRNDGNDWQLAIGLFALAPILERFEGKKAADVAFDRADAWNLRHYPEKSGAGQPSRDDTLRVVSDLIAARSPRLFDRLLEAISDPTAPEYSWSLEDGAIAVAKTRGLKAALPILERLRQAPPPRADAQGNRSSIEWRYANAVRRALAEGQVDEPAEALRLAQSLPPNSPGGNDFNRARAIAEAAFSLPLEQARLLWRESLASLEPSLAARYAIRIAPKDAALAREILEAAALKLQGPETNRGVWGLERNVAGFAFYEADFDAARARYRLEKNWIEAAKADPNGRGRSASVRAMAKFDGARAWQWAKQLDEGADDFQPGIEARRKITQWIEADARARQNVPFDRWGASDTWSFGDQEW